MENKFECKYCKKSYSTKGNLGKHFKTCKVIQENKIIEKSNINYINVIKDNEKLKEENLNKEKEKLKIISQKTKYNKRLKKDIDSLSEQINQLKNENIQLKENYEEKITQIQELKLRIAYLEGKMENKEEKRTNAICKHDIRKSTCKECGGNDLCKSEWCETRKNSNKKFEGYCSRCFINLFPGEIISRNYKTKQNEVTKTIINHENLKQYESRWKIDKEIKGGCSKRRPDILIDLFTHILIVEIDENQHVSIDCENKRMLQIFKDLGNRPCVFIRFNPDGYKIGNKIISSCWSFNENNIIVLKQTKKIEWQERLKLLIEKIKYHIENIPQKELEIIKLFFDE